METMKAIALRKSTRSFKPDQIPDDVLDLVLKAGCAAPVGVSDYDSLRLSVIQDRAVLDSIVAAAADAFSDPQSNILYDAPTLIVIASGGGQMPHLAMSNVACVAQNMLLAATDAGLDSVYVWSTSLALKNNPSLAGRIGLPAGFEVMASVALGYATMPDRSEKALDKTIAIHYVKG